MQLSSHARSLAHSRNRFVNERDDRGRCIQLFRAFASPLHIARVRSAGEHAEKGLIVELKYLKLGFECVHDRQTLDPVASKRLDESSRD